MATSGAFDVLGDLFPDENSARALVEDLGLKVARLPAFTAGMQPGIYWRGVARAISRGAFPGVDLQGLLLRVSREYPDNVALKSVVALAVDLARRRQFVVLLLAAAPTTEAHLRLDVEQREIQSAVRGGTRAIDLHVHPATRTGDLIRQIIDVKPDVVQFCGHGSGQGELIFEDDEGLPVPVDLATLGRVFARLGPLEAVVMTSCFSGSFAEALVGSVRMVIGADRPLEDRAAIAFSHAFYTALSGGRPVDGAFEAGRAGLDLAGFDPLLMRIRPEPGVSATRAE